MRPKDCSFLCQNLDLKRIHNCSRFNHSSATKCVNRSFEYNSVIHATRLLLSSDRAHTKAPVQIQYAPSHSRGLNCGASVRSGRALEPKMPEWQIASDAACFAATHKTKYYLEQGAQLYIFWTCKEKQRNCNFCVERESRSCFLSDVSI